MNTAASFLLAAFLLATTPLRAADMQNTFIRTPGQYHLDANGSTLTITQPQPGSWTLKLSYVSIQAASTTTSSSTSGQALRADGWFIFVENPTRVWVFDGIDAGALYTHTAKESGVKAFYFSQQTTPACPRPFWNALPKKLRAKHKPLAQ